jgi:hypothetical protein
MMAADFDRFAQVTTRTIIIHQHNYLLPFTNL